MIRPLIPCPSCARHVHAEETACPFCRAALPASFALLARPGLPRRMGRAAALTFTTSLAMGGCKADALDGRNPDGPPPDGGDPDGGAPDAATPDLLRLPDTVWSHDRVVLDGADLSMTGIPIYDTPPPRGGDGEK